MEDPILPKGNGFLWESYKKYNYQDYWKSRERIYEDAVERIALRNLLPSEGRRLIDLGSNYGRLAGEFSRYPQVILSDGAFSSNIQAMQLWGGSNYNVLTCDLRFSPFECDTFEVVICIRTIHHLENPETLFMEAKRLLKPGGYFILQFANKRNIKQKVLTLFGKSARKINDIKPVNIGINILNFHPDYIAQMLAAYGFEFEKVLGVSIFRNRLITRLFPIKLLVWLDSILQSINGKYYLTPSIFIRSKYTGSK